MTARILVIVIAMALAGATGFLLWEYGLRGDSGKKPPPLAATKVLVAKQDFPAGTILNADHWRWQTWPAEAVDEAYVVLREAGGGEAFDAEAEYRGAALRRAIGAGEPLTRNRVFRPGDTGFLAGVLSPGMRAVGIQISAVSSAAGFIRPGDRVDVILTQQLRRRTEDPVSGQMKVVSESILTDIRVLAIDQNLDDVDKKAKVGKTATIEVTPKQAEMVTLAARMGRLSLALRSLADNKKLDDRTGLTSDIEVSQALVGGKPAATKRAPRRVLAAARDLPAKALLRDADLRWMRPVDGISPDHYVEGKDGRETLRGALIRRAFKSGRPLSSDAVITPDTPGFVTAALQPGRRSILLGREAVAAILGSAAPGDRVDVVLTRRAGSTAGSINGHTSDTIISGLRILKLDPQRGTANLEVTPDQAAALAVIGKVGEISLTLGGDSAPTGGDGIGASLAALLESQANGAPVEAASAAEGPRVLVALRDIPKGVLLRDADVDWRSSRVGAAADVFVEGRDKLVTLRGALVEHGIAKGAPLSTSDIIKPGTPGFLAAALSPGRRAISIAVDAVTGVSGFVAPGDRVDIILTQEIRNQSAGWAERDLVVRRFSETVLRGIRVLAIEQSLDPKTGQPMAGRTATIEVTAEQAEIVALAATMGRLSLSLGVISADAKGRPGGVFTSDLGISAAARDFILRGRGAAPSNPERGAAPPPPPRTSGPDGVKLYRGASPVELNFER